MSRKSFIVAIMARTMGGRLRAARLDAGFGSASAAATRFHWTASTYRAHENGQNDFGPKEAEIYGRSFKVRPAWLLTGELPMRDGEKRLTEGEPKELPFIPILGKVAAGSFIDVIVLQHEKPKASAFPPDPRFPIESQFDLVVEGSSINRFAQEGDIIRCVDIRSSGIDVRDGDMVIVERACDTSLRETTAKRLRIKGDVFELWPESTDPLWQEPYRIVNGGHDQHDEISIIARVLWKYREP